MRLELQEGSHLYSADGEDLGTVRQFVVQPSTGEVSHVLVEKGVFFTNDRIVPVETIDRTKEDRLVLRGDLDPADLPRFVREHYAELDDATRERLDVPTGSHYVWRHPTALVGPFPIYPAFPMPPNETDREEVDEPPAGDHLAGSEVIDSLTPVLSTKGEKVGTVSEMHVDEAGRLSHLVVDLGFLDGKKVLPAHWIDSIDADGVHLAVGDSVLQTLETIT